MGKIVSENQKLNQSHHSSIDILLDSDEKISISMSSRGDISISELRYGLFLKNLWTCDNRLLLEKCFPRLKDEYVCSLIKQIAKDILSRFESKSELIYYLKDIKVKS